MSNFFLKNVKRNIYKKEVQNYRIRLALSVLWTDIRNLFAD